MDMLGPRVRVSSVKRLSGFRALVSFDNGSQKEIDLEPYLNGPVFEAIRDQPAVFRSMKIAGGTIAWEGGADIDPDVLRYGLNAAWAEQSEATRREPKRSESGVSIDETAT